MGETWPVGESGRAIPWGRCLARERRAWTLRAGPTSATWLGRGRAERHSHTVQDEAQEHEHIVALVVLHVAYKALTQLAQVAGPREAPLVHEGAPGPDGRAAPLQPLTARAGWDQFWQQGPGGRGQVSGRPRPRRDLQQEWGCRNPNPGVLRVCGGDGGGRGKGLRLLDPRRRGGRGPRLQSPRRGNQGPRL